MGSLCWNGEVKRMLFVGGVSFVGWFACNIPFTAVRLHSCSFVELMGLAMVVYLSLYILDPPIFLTVSFAVMKLFEW